MDVDEGEGSLKLEDLHVYGFRCFLHVDGPFQIQIQPITPCCVEFLNSNMAENSHITPCLGVKTCFKNA